MISTPLFEKHKTGMFKHVVELENKTKITFYILSIFICILSMYIYIYTYVQCTYLYAHIHIYSIYILSMYMYLHCPLDHHLYFNFNIFWQQLFLWGRQTFSSILLKKLCHMHQSRLLFVRDCRAFLTWQRLNGVLIDSCLKTEWRTTRLLPKDWMAYY